MAESLTYENIMALFLETGEQIKQTNKDVAGLTSSTQ